MRNELINISKIIQEAYNQDNGFNEDLLRVLIFEKENELYGCIKAEVPGVHSLVNGIETKVLIEIDRWIHAIVDEADDIDRPEKVKREASKLKSLSPALYDLYRLEHYNALRRTSRMLLFFKALIGASQDPPMKPSLVSTELFKESQSIVNGCDALKNALKNVLKTKDELPIKTNSGKFFISMPLLMVISIAMSQCEFFRPIIWEAYSALRAREELKEKWRNLKQKYINIIAFFIRYQTASGQLVRHTGDDRFIKKAGKTSKRDLLPFNEEILLDALKIISIIEEARNHMLPGYDSIATINHNSVDEARVLNKIIKGFNLNQDVDRTWGKPTWYMVHEKTPKLPNISDSKWNKIINAVYRDPEHLKEDLGRLNNFPQVKKTGVDPIRNAKKIFSKYRKGLEFTWGYFTTMKLHPNQMKKFEEISNKLATKKFKKILGSETKDEKNKPPKEIVAFSFGRQQSQDLKDSLCDFIRNVVKENNISKYEECFMLHFHPIPECIDYKDLKHPKEYLVEILLDDIRAAQKLLFNRAEMKPDAQKESTGEKAVDLFLHLYGHALEEFELRGDMAKLSDKKGKLYMPFPLLKRLLDVVYRLRPKSCFTIPVTFDDMYPHAIHIPNDFDVEKNVEQIKLIANYVNAYVLNQGMSRGFKKCDLGLGVLVDESNPAKWKYRIEEYFKKNGYDVLTEKYLRDFNTERLNVEKVSSYRPSMLLPTELDQLNPTLRDYFTANNISRQKIFLGVDVGGTLTKFQFYKFCDSNGFKELGDKFQIKTSFQIQIRNSSQNKPSDILSDSALEFTDRIIKKIKDQITNEKIQINNILAVGISWPGPVRNNRIAGTSGILKNFPPLQNIIKNNKIEDIMALDIVNAFKKKWEKAFKKEWEKESKKNKKGDINNYTFLVNDGDADGSGALEHFRSGENGKGGVGSNTDLTGGLVVIKLGTGTAGAVFVNGRKEPGLNEWGKIVLDLATKADETYPKSVANHYLSAKAIPTFFARMQDYETQEREIDSIELDLALRTINNDKNENEKLQDEFIEECGIRQVAKELNNKFDSEQIRTALRTDSEESGKIQDKSSKLLQKDLENAVRASGEYRIGNLLPTDSDQKNKMKKDIKKSAEAMGNYLGDFIVLQYDMYQTEKTLKVLLGGGVLSGTIGEIAKKKAIERVSKYNLNAVIEGPLMTVKSIKKKDSKESSYKTSKEESPSDSKEIEKKNFSTSGAAIFAAISLLFVKKEEGLQKIEQKLLHLKPNDSIRIYKGKDKEEVVFIIDNREEQDNTINLKEYSLKGEDVEKYLLTHGKDLGFYTLNTPGDFREYTRW